MNTMPSHSIQRQRGAALIVSLILLLVMTLLGVSAMQTNMLEEKMAGNFRDRDLAFQAAEAALRYAENEILKASLSDFTAWASCPPAPVAACPPMAATGGKLGPSYDDSGVDYSADSSLWKTPGAYDIYDHPTLPPAKDPKYVIKLQNTSGSRRIFKITAYAEGNSPGTAVVLRSYYQREN